MATYTEISIPFKSGTVNIEFNGVSLCDFHLVTKQLEDFIAKRVSQSPSPMRPLEPEERPAIEMTSWHTPPIGELEAPFEEECADLTKACHPDDQVFKPVITKMPEKPKTAWQFFLCQSKLGFKDAGEKWRNIEPSLKKHYEQISESDKMRYAEEMKLYNEYKSKTETTPQFPSAPIGWSGPYPNTWVKKNVQVNSRSVKIFKTFEEAVEVANTMEDCGGITQCSRGFSLRVGKTRNSPIPRVIENGKYRGICSWVKTVQEPPCYDGSDGITSYHDLNCTVRAYN